MGLEKRLAGGIGEEMAAGFLQKRGYRILCRNYRTPLGEIDIVAAEKGVIVFVEVKTRVTSSLGPGCISVTPAKQRHIIKNAWCYLKKHGLVDTSWRIDVVSVKLDAGFKLEDIELIKNAVTNDGY